MRSALLVTAALLLAGCTDDPEPPESPDPIVGSDPGPSGLTGFFEITIEPSTGDHVPTDLDVGFAIKTVNAVGQAVDGNVSWTLRLEGPIEEQRTGTGKQGTASFPIDTRGAYRITVNATAPGFHATEESVVVPIDPVPLQASLDATNATERGTWFAINASATFGYSDLGYACAWSGDGLDVTEETACVTQARWLEEGNRTLDLSLDDGHSTVNVSTEISVGPLVPLERPGSVPEDPLIQDAAESAPDETPKAGPYDLTAAWLASDIDHLYAGLAVAEIPQAASTSEITYAVQFTPSWNATIDDATIDAFRLVSIYTADDPSPPDPPSQTRHFRLEAQIGGDWSAVTDVSGSLSAEDGIFWWSVDRVTLQAPLHEAVLSDVSASTDGPLDSDSASADDTYALA